MFTTLDLWSAYNLVQIYEGHEWKTTFITPAATMNISSCHMSNSPSIFQALINEVFLEVVHHYVIIYIDNTLIYFQNLAKHRYYMMQVLQTLLREYLKLEKCEFHHDIIHMDGSSPSTVCKCQRKVDAILSWPQPTTIKDL